MKIPNLPKYDERAGCGQFSSKRAAQKAASRYNHPHRVVKTVTYRDLQPYYCWTIVLGK